MNLENKPQKKHSNLDQVTFSYNLDLQNGSLRVGRASHFFHLFSSLGPLWASLGSKWCQRASSWDHFPPMLGPIYLKNTLKCALQWETKPNIYRSLFWKLVSISSCFSLYLSWFCVQSTAHEGMEAQGVIGRPRSVFEIWWACRPIFHFIL